MLPLFKDSGAYTNEVIIFIFFLSVLCLSLFNSSCIHPSFTQFISKYNVVLSLAVQPNYDDNKVMWI